MWQIEPWLLWSGYMCEQWVWLQAHEWENVPAPHVTMVSFGQPRVGNLPFAEDYGALHALMQLPELIRSLQFATLPAPRRYPGFSTMCFCGIAMPRWAVGRHAVCTDGIVLSTIMPFALTTFAALSPKLWTLILSDKRRQGRA